MMLATSCDAIELKKLGYVTNDDVAGIICQCLPHTALLHEAATAGLQVVHLGVR